MYQRPNPQHFPHAPLFKRNSEIQGANGEGLHQDRWYENREIWSQATSDEGHMSDFHILMTWVLFAAFIDWIFW